MAAKEKTKTWITIIQKTTTMRMMMGVTKTMTTTMERMTMKMRVVMQTLATNPLKLTTAAKSTSQTCKAMAMARMACIRGKHRALAEVKSDLHLA